MKHIKLLDSVTISKIAAGEVVERPSAIVKELVENSIDAGSTEVTVEIAAGGKDYIKVSDNGCGIVSDDAIAAFDRHSTSKINSIADVYSLHTMGFRGEALHSIAAVSNVRLLTKTADEAVGYEVRIMGGELKHSGAAPATKGTSVEVSDLFYNTPVRWKFMKTTTQERRSVLDIVSKLAISNANVSVTFQSDGELVFKTDGKSVLKNTIMQVYGSSIADELAVIECDMDGVKVTGLSSKFSLRKRNRNFIMSFVNGRYVKSVDLQRTIEGTYRAHLMGGEFPVSFVFVELDPSAIDVNVHPSKTEIKFSDYKKVGSVVKSALKMMFHKHAHIPNVSQSKGFSSRFGDTRTQADKNLFDNATGRDISAKAMRQIREEPASKAGQVFDDDLRLKNELETEPNPFAAESLSYTTRDESPLDIAEKERDTECCRFDDRKEAEHSSHQWEAMPQSSEEGSRSMEQGETYSADNHTVYKTYTAETQSFFEEETRFDFTKVRIIGIFDTTFILGEYEGVLYVFDQHAAHEKVLFEEYKKAFEEGTVSSQMLLMPFEVRAENGVENLNLKDLGFEVEPFGVDTIVVRSVPAGMSEAYARDFLEHLLEIGEIDRHSDPFKTATKSCRSAIMSGDRLLDIEVEELMRRLTLLDDPFNCPHGRPIIVKFTRKELDKMFKRIL